MGSGSAALIAGLVALTLAGGARSECAPGLVEFRGPAGAIAAFTVELADTPALRERGLMFREAMDPGAGMLFSYPAPEHAYYWMKNTLIPLDMIFADASGRVQVVHAGAVPGDLTSIDGGPGVSYVLEVNAGRAAELGIVPGVEMRAWVMDPKTAAWPCQ